MTPEEQDQNNYNNNNLSSTIPEPPTAPADPESPVIPMSSSAPTSPTASVGDTGQTTGQSSVDMPAMNVPQISGQAADALSDTSTEKSKTNQRTVILAVVCTFVLTAICAVVVVLLILPILQKMAKDEAQENPGQNTVITKNPVAGAWSCKKFSDLNEDSYATRLVLNDDGTFIYGPYDDLDNNHFAGGYSFENLEKQNYTKNYEYYSITLDDISEYMVNGEKREASPESIPKLEMGVATGDNREAIVIFPSTNNMYYCDAD